jgi:cell wall-associated NlpC family hydrolase
MHPSAQGFVQAARAWVGTPFVHQGRAKGVGADCGGLVVGAAREAGLCVQDVTGYGREPHRGMLQRILLRQFLVVREPAPGDLLLMRFAAEPQHLAILAGSSIIHAYEHHGRVIEHRYADVWRARTVAAYRFHEFAGEAPVLDTTMHIGELG